VTTTQNNHALAAQNHSGLEATDRQIEATLALAYEQRAANLIAFLQLPMHLQSIEERVNAMEAVKERLGL
jgi:hypothetical protein